MRPAFCLIMILGIAIAGCGSDLTPVRPDSPVDVEALRALEPLKDGAESGVLGMSAALGTGGPDTFGYTWIDSDDPGGPVYSWVDISGIGTPVGFLPYHDDGNVGPLPIGFSFPFYGNTFTEFYACTNGWLSFTNNALATYVNQPLPNIGSSVPENFLAAWWDDMVHDENDGNAVYYHFDGSRFIVQYDVRRIGDLLPPYFKFQVILYPNGNIVYQYHTLGPNQGSCTIGIQNAAKDDGLTVVHNDSTYPHEGLAILFVAPQGAEITIDIKPESGNNRVNPRSKGVIPVAILTTDAFDATQIDASTIAFGPDGAPIAHKHAHVEDVDGDGDQDLLVHFRTQETGIVAGDTEACLTAELYDGTPVQDCDTLVTVPLGAISSGP